MRNRLLAMGAAVELLLTGVPSAEARPRQPALREASPGRPSGFRTDRLSGEQLEAWNAIVAIVAAEDRDGRPLHPTLRRLWDAVGSSAHVIHIELPDSKRSYTAGRFAITRVDPEGKSHEGTLMLNLRAIDRASTGRGAARADGFVPFQGLGRKERYAEVLGHELGHALWSLADPERARLVMPLQSAGERLMRRVVHAAPESANSAELRARATEFERLSRALEESAEAAERAVWEELRASQGLR
jgi:hypothetical protein